MNIFEDFFYNRVHRNMHKWTHYLPIYNKEFSHLIGKDVKILEIGVKKGGSLDMWAYVFGDKSNIVGVDIDQECKNLERNNIKIEIGSQNDSTFLNDISKKYGKFDIIIDDGSHYNKDQKYTLNYAFENLLNDHGIYLVEDCHTSYYNFYTDGGYKNSENFIEFCKNLIDEMNAKHSKEIEDTYFTNNLDSINFYDSIVVLHKKTDKPDLHEMIVENPSLRRIDLFLKQVRDYQEKNG